MRFIGIRLRRVEGKKWEGGEVFFRSSSQGAEKKGEWEKEKEFQERPNRSSIGV
jgi:hypothetical protein